MKKPFRIVQVELHQSVRLHANRVDCSLHNPFQSNETCDADMLRMVASAYDPSRKTESLTQRQINHVHQKPRCLGNDK